MGVSDWLTAPVLLSSVGRWANWGLKLAAGLCQWADKSGLDFCCQPVVEADLLCLSCSCTEISHSLANEWGWASKSILLLHMYVSAAACGDVHDSCDWSTAAPFCLSSCVLPTVQILILCAAGVPVLGWCIQNRQKRMDSKWFSL